MAGVMQSGIAEVVNSRKICIFRQQIPVETNHKVREKQGDAPIKYANEGNKSETPIKAEAAHCTNGKFPTKHAQCSGVIPAHWSAIFSRGSAGGKWAGNHR